MSAMRDELERIGVKAKAGVVRDITPMAVVMGDFIAIRPDVAAALVAVADAWGRAYAALHDLRASLDALAAALGVSR